MSDEKNPDMVTNWTLDDLPRIGTPDPAHDSVVDGVLDTVVHWLNKHYPKPDAQADAGERAARGAAARGGRERRGTVADGGERHRRGTAEGRGRQSSAIGGGGGSELTDEPGSPVMMATLLRHAAEAYHDAALKQ